MASLHSEPVSDEEAAALFADLQDAPALVLAVSGGPDSTALMVLAARWRAARKHGPKLVAVTVDHGLRPEAQKEAAAVAKLACKLGIAHRTVRWTGRKPKAGIQQAARLARYRLLAEAARKAKAAHILTAHTLDDQAETMLIRMSRGSGITGLGAMAKFSVIPGRVRSTRARNPYSAALRRMDSGPGPAGRPGMTEAALVRPLLSLPKSRLVATLRAAGIPFAEDPSNRDPRFTRARLRSLMPRFAEEGLDAARLATLARRLRRADAAIEAAVDGAAAVLTVEVAAAAFAYDRAGFAGLPDEVGLRLLGRAIAAVGDEGPVELAKLEALKASLDTAGAADVRFRRTLAGAVVTLAKDSLTVERAPPRRGKSVVRRGLRPLTKHRAERTNRAK